MGGFEWGIDANDGVQFTSQVGQYRANQFGLYDMHGNVWEFCKDWYDKNQYKHSPDASKR